MKRPGRWPGFLAAAVLAAGLAMYFMGRGGTDVSLRAFADGDFPAAEAKVGGFVHTIDAAGRSLTLRERVGGATAYRTVVLTPTTEFLLVTRARGMDALEHPFVERRIRPDEVRLDDYVVVALTPSGEGSRAATVTVVHSARG